MDTYLKKFASSDALIGNAAYFNYDYRSGLEDEIETTRLSESFIEACRAQDGFLEGGRIYAARSQVGLDAETYEAPDTISRDENGDYYNTFGGIKQTFDKLDDTVYNTSFYGVEEFLLKKIDVWEGEDDPDVIREKLLSGNYILSSTQVDDNNFVEEERVMHHAGDKLTLVLPDGTRKEVEVLSVIKEDYYGLTDRSGSDFTYYTMAEVFRKWISDKFLMSYAFDIEDGKEAGFDTFLKDYTTTVEPLMNYESRQSKIVEYESMIGMVTLIGGMLTLIIAVIGVLNFVNSILTSLVTRQREFAMMEAIGMTKKQLVKMLMLEGLSYAGLTIAASLIISNVFSLTVVRTLAEGLWFLNYHYQFLIAPMFIVFLILLLLGAFIPRLSYKGQDKKSLIEKMRENE